jgi:hypothetical protein
MLAWLMVLAQDSGALVGQARRMLSAERRCPVEATTDITVCGLRRADRYRVPMLSYDPGDPAHEGVPAERERLLARTTPLHDLSPFLVGGGMVGATAMIGAGGGKVSTLRPLAP